jgi:hypothetical protein
MSILRFSLAMIASAGLMLGPSPARAQGAVPCYALCWTVTELSCVITLTTAQEAGNFTKLVNSFKPGTTRLVFYRANNSSYKLPCGSQQVSIYGVTITTYEIAVHGTAIVTVSGGGTSAGPPDLGTIVGSFLPSDATIFPDAGSIQ